MSQMKIVIALNSEKSSVGISKPDCDPVFNTIDGGLDAVIARLPELVRAAEEKFTAAPRNPPSNLPAPAPVPAPVHTGSKTTDAVKKQDTTRPSMF